MAANQTVNVYGITPYIESTFASEAKKRVTYGLNFPLGEKKTTGGFFKKESGVNLIRDAVSQLLQTERGERVMLPGFGCNLRKYLSDIFLP